MIKDYSKNPKFKHFFFTEKELKYFDYKKKHLKEVSLKEVCDTIINIFKKEEK